MAFTAAKSDRKPPSSASSVPTTTSAVTGPMRLETMVW
jgi:hypothetical protein